METVPKDPWGNEYGYEPPPPGTHEYRVFTYGSDTVPGRRERRARHRQHHDPQRGGLTFPHDAMSPDGRRLHRDDPLRRAGFTLIELMVVVIIIGMIGGIAMVSWEALLPNQKFNTAVRRLSEDLHKTRSEAIARSREFGIYYNIDDGLLLHPHSLSSRVAGWLRHASRASTKPRRTCRSS